MMRGTKLSWATSFLASYPLSRAKTELSVLALKRQLGVKYRTAWALRHKLLQAMTERDAHYEPRGIVKLEDSLGDERAGGKSGPGSENKGPFCGSVCVQRRRTLPAGEADPVAGFSFLAIAEWAQACLALGGTAHSKTVAFFSGVVRAYDLRQPMVGVGGKPNHLPVFQWVNTALGSLKAIPSGG